MRISLRALIAITLVVAPVWLDQVGSAPFGLRALAAAARDVPGPVGRPVLREPGATFMAVVTGVGVVPPSLLSRARLQQLGENEYNYDGNGDIVPMPVIVAGSLSTPTLQDALKALDHLQPSQAIILGLSKGMQLTIATNLVPTGAAVYYNDAPGKLTTVSALVKAIDNSYYYVPVAIRHSTGLRRSQAPSAATQGGEQLTVPNKPIPSAVDLSAGLPPVGDQGNENSCVAWAVSYYYKSFQEGREHHWSLKTPDHQFSPSYVYNLVDDGQDDGADIGDTMQLIETTGDVPLSLFPYQDGDYKLKPSASLADTASIYRAANYGYFFDNPGDEPFANDISVLKRWLARGDGLVIGLEVFDDSFDDYQGGVYDGPYKGDDPTSDGHAMMVVGYDDNAEGTGIGAFKVVNSYGTDWGEHGFAWISYRYVAKYADDAWAMKDLLNDPPLAAPVAPAENPGNSNNAGQAIGYDSDGTFKTLANKAKNDYIAAVTFEYQRYQGDTVLEDRFYTVRVELQPDDDVIVSQNFRMSDGAIVTAQVEIVTDDPPDP